MAFNEFTGHKQWVLGIDHYKSTLHAWNYGFPWSLKDDLKRLVNQNMKNTDWIKWYEKAVVQTHEINIDDWTQSIQFPAPIAPATQITGDQLNQAFEQNWPNWIAGMYRYTPEADAALDQKALAQKNKQATQYVKSTNLWKYNTWLLNEFRHLLEGQLPRTQAAEDKSKQEVDQLAPEAPEADRLEIYTTNLKAVKNANVRDPKFGFKKNKNLDGRGASQAILIYFTRFKKIPKKISEYPKLYMVDQVHIAELSYDPKLHPSGKDYVITDMIRRALGMDPRKTFQTNTHKPVPPRDV